MENTIIAQSSARGQGAIAVIRMSGKDVVDIFEKAVGAGFACPETYPENRIGNNLGGQTPPLRHAVMQRHFIYGKNGDVIDDIMATIFFAPKSFTGENVAEIFCHGSQITVERIIKRFLELGAVVGGRGEFTKRAFLNGKINLHKAEAINAVISAKDYYSHKNAMSQYMGRGVEFFDEIKEKLQNIMVALESEIEFSETDELNGNNPVGATAPGRPKIEKTLAEITQKLSLQKQKYAQLQKIANGIPTLLVGRTNAGKSSLFNCLLNENRAIVNEKSGTTRDVITETVHLDDVVIRLFDTAGLNESEDDIENEGIKRTKNEIDKAFAALWVISPYDREYANDYELIKNIPVLIAVLNKSDKGENPVQRDFMRRNAVPYIKFSASGNHDTKEITDLLRTEIEEKFPEKTFDTVLTSQRELRITEQLLELIETCDFCTGVEILAEQVREMLVVLDEIYGFMAPDEIMNKIFDSFCIGK
ncbi:MAG: tRNA uridine-5-carboxymethylaminomethyl(34) synthesis GTPase MnmE [Chitinivibrionia bacterium]|nr:tRNA uridine-5-carboxymethylaminomethyl(34) synthesis GTPase MnmE [Chitinivibrionia bacterium]